MDGKCLSKTEDQADKKERQQILETCKNTFEIH